MITHVQGMLQGKKAPSVVIDVNGVGYEILAPMSTFTHLPSIGDAVKLLTHLSISENAHTLYGFYHEQERNLFRALIKVSGVGPKLALAILSGIEPDHFVSCVRAQDTSSLVRIPGVGKKTAERLIIETRDALAHWQHDAQDLLSNTQDTAISQTQAIDDAISALTALGYKSHDAKRAIDKVYDTAHDSERLIRLALQQMVRRS